MFQRGVRSQGRRRSAVWVRSASGVRPRFYMAASPRPSRTTPMPASAATGLKDSPIGWTRVRERDGGRGREPRAGCSSSASTTSPTGRKASPSPPSLPKRAPRLSGLAFSGRTLAPTAGTRWPQTRKSAEGLPRPVPAPFPPGVPGVRPARSWVAGAYCAGAVVPCSGSEPDGWATPPTTAAGESPRVIHPSLAPGDPTHGPLGGV